MLSPDQIYQYHEQGYVIPDYRLSDDIIEEIKIAHKRLITKSPQFSDYCGALLIEDLSFLNYARDQNILDMVSQLIGPDIALWNSSCGPLELKSRPLELNPVSYTHLTLPTKRIV